MYMYDYSNELIIIVTHWDKLTKRHTDKGQTIITFAAAPSALTPVVRNQWLLRYRRGGLLGRRAGRLQELRQGRQRHGQQGPHGLFVSLSLSMYNIYPYDIRV